MLQPIACFHSEIAGAQAGSLLLRMDVRKAAARLLPEYAESVQAVYLDPPFNTGKRFGMRARAGEKTISATAYEDRHESREAYLSMMSEALTLAKALLRENGTIFLHCDGRMNAYLRLLMDTVFGEENFLNEIIWSYQSGGRSLRHFPRKHDSILLYARSPQYAFNLKAVPIGTAGGRENHMRREVDETGRSYRAIRSGGKEYRYYDDEPVYPSDVWTDIPHLQQRDPERTGFETQKPLALLSRILLCATKEGDLVCDLFHGSGTTAVAAQGLKRRFLCLDDSALSMALSERRLLPRDGKPPVGGFVSEAESAMDGEAEVSIRLSDSTYSIGFSALTSDAAKQADVPGPDTIESLSAGYLRDGIFHIVASAHRDRRQQLPHELEIPIENGIPCLRMTDIWGNRRFFCPQGGSE